MSTSTTDARPGRRAQLLVGVLMTLGLLFWYVRHEREQVGVWVRATEHRAAARDTLERIPTSQRPQLTVLVHDLSTWQAPGVPVFYAGDDINSAAQIWLDEPTLRAWLIPAVSGVRCEGTQVVAVDNIGAERVVPYPSVAFADVGHDIAGVAASRGECERLLARMSDAPPVNEPAMGDRALPT